jgi:hypothetical protein
MKDSFVFYRSFFESLKELPDEQQLKFYQAITEYALDDTEPDFTGLEKSLFTQIKFSLDEANRRYEESRLNGKKGGRPRKVEEKNPPLKTEKPPFFEKKPTLKTENLNENVYVDVYVDENENLNSSTLSQELKPQKYAQEVFDLFEKNNLPCCNKNFISFLQKDFKFALEYIHNSEELRGIHSDDVIQAVKNYISVLKNKNTYLKNKYTFDRLLKIKNFKDFLPDNFVFENFTAWDKKQDETPKPIEPTADPFSELEWVPTTCKKCGKNLKRKNMGSGLLVVQCECGAWAEYNNNKKAWEWE